MKLPRILQCAGAHIGIPITQFNRGAGTLSPPKISTALTLPGYKVVKNLGVVRGITVRSRSIVCNLFGGLQSLFWVYSECLLSIRELTGEILI
jgi:hypothetical protein